MSPCLKRQFYKLLKLFRARSLIRPNIETGYEAILAMRLLYLGETIESIHSGYGDKIQALLKEAQVTANDLKKLFWETRDVWIANDLAEWVMMNPLFDGVAAKLRKLGQQYPWHVVTTKQERFIKQILKANELASVKLIFALWGYNTAEDKVLAAKQPFALQQNELI
jgi:phosphoglycolate phosphatase-like HAD superfamily hydrolase